MGGHPTHLIPMCPQEFLDKLALQAHFFESRWCETRRARFAKSKKEGLSMNQNLQSF